MTMIVNVSAGSCGAIALEYMHAVGPMSVNVVVRVAANVIVCLWIHDTDGSVL